MTLGPQTMIAHFQIEVDSPGHCKTNSRYLALVGARKWLLC